MDLARAIKETVAYSDYFLFPLFPSEIHNWLISSRPVSFAALKKYLSDPTPKQIRHREKLLQNTRQKITHAQKLIKYARFIPLIRLIAITGSVAVGNTDPGDDLDLLIVTAPNTLWLVRPLFLLLLSIKFNRRHPGDDPKKVKDSFCPNLWLESNSLSIPNKRRNLYTAHEVLQVMPLLDRGDTYQTFLGSNSWTKHYLANAYQKLHKDGIKKQNNSIYSLVIAPINYMFFTLQYLYMLPKITSEAVSLHSAYFHKNDPSILLNEHLHNKKL